MSAVRFSAKHPQEGSEPDPDDASIRVQLERILASEQFQHSRRYPALLRYVVEQALAGAQDELKERTLGVAVFRRNPEYDTSVDPVVRTTASEIRKRLEVYYAEPDHARELRITLPVGAYVPEFRLPPDQEQAQTIPHPAAIPGPRRWRVWAVAALMVMMVGLGVALRIEPKENALHRFWEPVWKTSPPVLLVVETLIGRRRPVAQPALAVSPVVEEILDPKLFLIVNEGNSKIAAYFGANGKALEYELARNVTLAKLRTRPFILKGAFNNPLTRQAVSSLRYSLNLDRPAMVRQIVDRQNPSQHWDSPMGDLAKDYALIVRAPEPRTGQTMIVIAGLGERGGAAATEFLTNPQYMDRFAARAPRGWEHRNLEIVLETELANGDWGEPHIVAAHVW
jgi:hypothetical protein